MTAPHIIDPEGGFQTVLADPPWRFANRTGRAAPEHRRLGRYGTMGLVAGGRDIVCGEGALP